MVQLSALVPIVLVACSVSALPQGPPNTGTTGNGTDVVLSEATVASLPLNVIVGGDTATVVQASNSSLVEARPDIVADANASLQLIPDPTSNLTKRAECPGGIFAFPTTPFTNVLLIANRVCDFWFPNNQVSYLPVPLPAPGFRSIAVPFGPGLPTVTYKYQTQSFPPVDDLVTPMTATICKARYTSILNFVTSSLSCPGGIQVHDGDDLDEKNHATGFSFVVS